MITTKIVQQLNKSGFIDLGVINPSLCSFEVANAIGKILQIPGFNPVQKLLPKPKSESNQNTYSGNYGYSSFPLHSDLAHWHEPPQFFLLRCLVPDLTVTTNIIRSKDFIKGIGNNVIARALFKPRKKLAGQRSLLRFNSEDKYRWDSLFLIPENEEAIEISQHLNAIKESETEGVCLREPGHTILIDNWRTIHGRSYIYSNNSTRLVERVYLSELKNEVC